MMRFAESKRLNSVGETGVTFGVEAEEKDDGTAEAVAVDRGELVESQGPDEPDDRDSPEDIGGVEEEVKELMEEASAPDAKDERKEVTAGGPEGGRGGRQDVGGATRGPEDGCGRRQDVGEATRGPEDGCRRRQEVEEEHGDPEG